ncbi:MAG: Lrp/AsnC family transcriptional regulator, partial [Candidatus Thorarchaeota archaeon]
MEPKKLDKKDAEILTALDRMGGNVSAERLAEILDYPARTIRYRLSKLKDSGYLTTLLAMSHELQFGLGDAVVLLDTTDSKRDLTLSLLDSFPVFYYLSPSYGRYNGYLSHTAYIRDEYDEFNRIIDTLYDAKLITNHLFFDDADFIIFKADISQFSRDDRWRWNWKKWI